MGQSSFGVAFARTRVREGKPNFIRLIFIKEGKNMQNGYFKKRGVQEALLQSQRTPLPQAVAFNVNPHKIPMGKTSRQAHRIFSASASQFQGNGIGIGKISPPLPRHPFKVLFAGLNYIVALLNNYKSLEFAFHNCLSGCKYIIYWP